MPLQVSCSGCGAKFQAKDEWAGRKTKCPKCRTELVIGGASPASAAPSEAQQAESKTADNEYAVAASPGSRSDGFSFDIGDSNPPAFDMNLPTAPGPNLRTKPPVAVAPAQAGIPMSAKIGAGAVAGLLLLGLVIYMAVGSSGQGEMSIAPPTVAAAVVETVKPAAVKTAPAAAAAPVAKVINASEDLADVVERVKPAIVLISMFDSKGKELGLGSGFIISNNGLVATNYHVIDGAARATARFSNGVITEVAGVVRADKDRDLAVIRLSSVPSVVKPLTFAATAVLRQGAKVVAIGHPRGLDYSVTEGIISAVRTTSELPESTRDFLSAPSDQKWIQTTAAISGGNSGGPLMLPDGRVIGINTWVAAGENLGFAGHVQHLQDIIYGLPAAYSTEPLEAYNARTGGLKKGSMSQAEAVAQGLQSLYDQVEAIGWQPKTSDDAEKIENIIGGVSVARSRGFSPEELDSIGDKLAQKQWTFTEHVAKLNAHTIDVLRNAGRTVICFGTVVAVNKSDVRRFIVQLAGRGYEMEIMNMVTPDSPQEIGDQVLVMGIHTQQVSHVYQVAAGMIVKASWTQPPEDFVLQECSDLLKQRRKFEVLRKHLSDRYPKFVDMSPDSAEATERTAYALTLNSRGHRFDGVRIPASTKSPGDELALYFVAPPDSIEAWGLTSVDGEIPGGFPTTYEFNDFLRAVPNWPKTNIASFQLFAGGELANSKNHLLWFNFRDDKPVEVHVVGVYLPAGTVGVGHESLMQKLGVSPQPVSFKRALRLVSLERDVRGNQQRRPGGAIAGNSQMNEYSDSSAASVGGSSAVARSRSGGEAASAGEKLARIELPPYKSDEGPQSVIVGSLPSPAQAKLELINPDQPAPSVVASYEIVKADDGWAIESVNKKGERKKVARLFAESNYLKFQWEPDTSRADGGALRNCLIRIVGGGPEQTVVLRALTTREPLVIDFKKDFERISLGDDLPADSGLKIVMEGLDKMPQGTTVSEPTVGFKTPMFVVLTPSQNEIPGARLRMVLWRSGMKTEMIVRPELTPISTPQNLAVLKTAKSGSTKPDTGDDIDPLVANQRFLSFTIKGLASAKTMLERQLKLIRDQIAISERTAQLKLAQLKSYNGTVVTSATELAAIQAKISQLRNEIVALQNETNLMSNAVPGYLKQLEAFPPLEALGNAVHLTSSVRVRVVYQAGKYEVPLVEVGGK